MKKAKGTGLDSPALRGRLKNIRILILDVDGVLTNGTLFHLENQGWIRLYHVQDGYGMKLLRELGVEVAIISAGRSEEIRSRMAALGVTKVYLGDENKLGAFERILEETGLRKDQAAYMGDDLFDIPILERVGFSATVSDALDAVKRRVHYVTKKPGGSGAVREVIEGIRKAQALGQYLD